MAEIFGKVITEIILENCFGCGEMRPDVERRYSFGVYAGALCIPCCTKYRDNCGLDQPQGSPADLDEPYEADY